MASPTSMSPLTFVWIRSCWLPPVHYRPCHHILRSEASAAPRRYETSASRVPCRCRSRPAAVSRRRGWAPSSKLEESKAVATGAGGRSICNGDIDVSRPADERRRVCRDLGRVDDFSGIFAKTTGQDRRIRQLKPSVSPSFVFVRVVRRCPCSDSCGAPSSKSRAGVVVFLQRPANERDDFALTTHGRSWQ